MTYRKYEPPDGQEIPEYILENTELLESFLGEDIFKRHAEKDHEDLHYHDPNERCGANVDFQDTGPEEL